METVNASFVSACAKFFERRPGQTLPEFSAELKQLTNKDKRELCELFPSVGYTITDAANFIND